VKKNILIGILIILFIGAMGVMYTCFSFVHNGYLCDKTYTIFGVEAESIISHLLKVIPFILFTLLSIVLFVVILKGGFKSNQDPISILNKRFAKGEINEKEYQKIKEIINR
jgi:uncharacterized membrane protein